MLGFKLAALLLSYAAVCSADSCASSYTGAPLFVPDSAGPGCWLDSSWGPPFTQDLSVTRSGVVIHVTIGFSVTHTFVEDLVVFLQHPDGTRARLTAYLGDSTDFYTNTVFDDGAPISISAAAPPFTGTFRPLEPLSVFNGKPAAGTWKLVVYDSCPQDSGTFHDTSLYVSTNTASCAAPSTPCVTACGDPHFLGMDGVKYEFQGVPNRAFALISEPTVELNALFVRGRSAQYVTFMDGICLRSCNDTVVIRTPSFVTVNDKHLAIGAVFDNGRLSVTRPHKHVVEAAVRDQWLFNLRVNEHVDIELAHPFHQYEGKSHGVIGHTLKHRNVTAEPRQCNGRNEGGCEVEGTYRDYIVGGSDDLCGTVWKYSQFDAEACA